MLLWQFVQFCYIAVEGQLDGLNANKEMYHSWVKTGDVVELLDFLLVDVEFEGKTE